MAKILSQPYQPAAQAIRALAPARQPGHAASRASVLVDAILGKVQQLTANGGTVSSAQSDELRALEAEAVELICPLDDADADVRREHATVRSWIETAFYLLTAHLVGM